jgi:hypothetical protein
MNRRFALTAVACLFSVWISSVAAFQAKPAQTSPPAAAPAASGTAPAKWVPPMKGLVTVDFIQSKPERVKADIVTKIKVKNTSKGSIALLSVEEIWYNNKREIATNSGAVKNKSLLNPGDVVELTLVSPNKPDLYTNMLMFKHAYGDVKPTKVTKFN